MKIFYYLNKLARINVLQQIQLQQMQSDCCPICSKEYNLRSRKQMIICLKQHFICLNCADQISQKDSLCPFCRKKFDIAEIEPRRIFSEEKKVSSPIKKDTFCPIGHQEVKYAQKYATCLKCKTKNFIGGIQCQICFYRECSKCLNATGKYLHTQCGNSGLEFGQGEGYVAQNEDPTKRIVYGFTCNSCTSFTKKYIHCKKCNLYACPGCRSFAVKD